MRCKMMTAGNKLRCCVLGWIDVDVDVDEDDSLMLREEWTTKGQQSFTIRFRRDKLAVIFSRISPSNGWLSARPSLGMHQHPPWLAQLALDMLASVSSNGPPRPASRHCRSIRFQTQEGSVLYARHPFRDPRIPSLLHLQT